MIKTTIFIWCLLMVVFSYGFVEKSFPLATPEFLYQLVHFQRAWTTAIFVILVSISFVFYFFLLARVKKNKVAHKQVWQLVFLVVVILLFSWPAFSHDIFNYMATAKVTFFYRENPYLVMPIEFEGEPMLRFMHAANKFALYGPTWILLTAFPHFLGAGKLVLTVFTFKALVAVFYLGLCWLVWKISEENVYSLVFFALNPLVIIETLVSGHNDVVMMFFALLAFYLIWQKRRCWSLASLLVSIGVKFATLILVPLLFFANKLKKEKLIALAAGLMFLVFLASPLREEIYSWYFIWVLCFVALIPKNKLFNWLALAFSFSLLLRYTPFLYTRNWGGITPIVKTLTTFIPPVITLSLYELKRRMEF